jgi:hypothetical protein
MLKGRLFSRPFFIRLKQDPKSACGELDPDRDPVSEKHALAVDRRSCSNKKPG